MSDHNDPLTDPTPDDPSGGTTAPGEQLRQLRMREVQHDPRAPRPELIASNEGVRPIVPRTVEEAFRMAQAIVGAGLAPDSYDNDPQKILIGIMAGAEVGLPPLRALANIAIINKRASIYGDGAIALVQATGKVKKVDSYFEVDGSRNYWSIGELKDDVTAVYKIWRKDQAEPYEGRFSVADAKRAHLWGNIKRRPWIEYPQRMLMARARAYALRDGFADALSGLSIREEVEDLPAEPKVVEESRLNELLGPGEDKLQTPIIDGEAAADGGSSPPTQEPL